MLRLLILLGLVAAAAALVRALLRDRGERRRDRLASLRASFLHGAPIGLDVRPPGLREVLDRGIVRFHVPGSWIEEPAAAGGTAYLNASRAWTLRVELLSLEWEGMDADAVAAALGGLKPSLERTVEVLVSGLVLMKCLDAAQEKGQDLLLYSWRLGQPLPEGKARIAVFTLSAPQSRGEDVVLRSDLATLEREIRAASFTSS
jgi:hypothetical protein